MFIARLFNKEPYPRALPSHAQSVTGGWRPNDASRPVGMSVAPSVRPMTDVGLHNPQVQYAAIGQDQRLGGQSLSQPYAGPARPSQTWGPRGRHYTDVYAGVMFLLLFLFCVIGTFVTFARAEKQYEVYRRKDFQWNTPTCSVEEFRQWKGTANSTAQITQKTDSRLAYERGIKVALRAWVPVSILVSIMLGLGFIAAYRKFAKFMITFGLALCLCWAIAFMVVNFVWGNWPLGLITIFIIIAVLVAMVFCYKYIDIISQLFEVAGHGLGENPLVVVIITTMFILFFCLFVMFAFGIYYAIRVGGIKKNIVVQNINRNNYNLRIVNEVCQGLNDQYVRCCAWETSAWTGVYGVFVIILFVWMVLLLFEIKLYIVGGVLCRWYTYAGQSPWKEERFRAIQDTVRFAFMENFGSIALAGLIMWPLRLFRQIVSCFFNVFHCNVCYYTAQRFTRFVPVYMSYSGYSFCTAAYQLDRQTNHFSFNIGAWWVPQLVLWSSSILIALGYAAIPYGITYSSYGQVADLSRKDLLRLAWAVGWSSFAIALVMLMFIATLMVDVINSTFICYILDVSNPSVLQHRKALYDVFSRVLNDMQAHGTLPRPPQNKHSTSQFPKPMHLGEEVDTIDEFIKNEHRFNNATYTASGTIPPIRPMSGYRPGGFPPPSTHNPGSLRPGSVIVQAPSQYHNTAPSQVNGQYPPGQQYPPNSQYQAAPQYQGHSRPHYAPPNGLSAIPENPSMQAGMPSLNYPFPGRGNNPSPGRGGPGSIIASAHPQSVMPPAPNMGPPSTRPASIQMPMGSSARPASVQMSTSSFIPPGGPNTRPSGFNYVLGNANPQGLDRQSGTAPLMPQSMMPSAPGY